MSELFKELLSAYFRDVKGPNKDIDRTGLCAHLYIPPYTRRYMIEGVKRLRREGESAEVKILLRLLLPTISYETLMEILESEEAPPSEEGFRSYLQS